jgi:hypothetical protein
MLLRTKLEIALAVLVCACFAVVFSAWLQSRDDRIRMQVTIAAQKTAIEGFRDQMQSIRDGQAKRDAATASAISAMQQAVAKIRTPQQIAGWLPKQVKLPAPVTLAIPPSTAQNLRPDATAIIPQQDLVPIKVAVEGCKECALRLSTAQKDLLGSNQQVKIASEELSAMQRERDAALTASRGGSFWTRVRRSAKWFAIGSAVAAGALCSSGHCK